MKKIVFLGAAGNLGRHLRHPIARLCNVLLSVDTQAYNEFNAPPLADNERWLQADAADVAAMTEALSGADMVVHFAAIADERDFDTLLRPNFLSSQVIWQVAHQCGVRRIIYASSIHAVGLAEINPTVDLHVPHQPDSYYGLSKCFTEDMAKLYWHKCGLEAVCLRIGSCTAQPMNRRALNTWLSFTDLVHLLECSITTSVTRFCCIYGISNNDRSAFDNSAASFLGYRPKSNAEDYADTLLSIDQPVQASDNSLATVGGPFTCTALGESGVAWIARMNTHLKAPQGEPS